MQRGDIILQENRYTVQWTTGTVGPSFEIQRFRLLERTRIDLDNSMKGWSFQIHFVNACEVCLEVCMSVRLY